MTKPAAPFISCIVSAAVFTALIFASETVRAEPEDSSSQPNIVLMLADDMAWHDCGAYGSRQVRTPNIDRLADEGLTFDLAFTGTAMCSPSRQQLYTGLYPVRNGAYPNHSRVKPGTRSIVHHLRDLGYRVGLIGKKHVGPPESFPFEEASEAFLTADQSHPACLVYASHNPHLPWTTGPKDYDPDDLDVPPYLVDNRETRQALAKYYSEITAFDAEVGRWMKVVDDAGLTDNTIFIVTSEQGPQFPHAKWTCYDVGLRVAFIVRWPNQVAPGSRTEAMIHYVDVVPTLVEAAGGDPQQIDTGIPDGSGGTSFDGRSFLDVLLGRTNQHRDEVSGIQTTLGIIAGKPYPIRSVRDSRYKYIRNLMPETTFQNVVTERDTLYWPFWVRDAQQGDERARRLVDWYQHRPAEEFYDLQNDPFELNNLADDSQYRKRMDAMGARLDAWMQQQGDRGVEAELAAKSREGRSSK